VIGASSCTLCTLGRHSRYGNSSECEPCAPGTFAYATGLAECMPCALGYYQDKEMATHCEACSPGTYSSTIGADHCSDCPANKNSGEFAASSCNECPYGSTAVRGSANCRIVWWVPTLAIGGVILIAFWIRFISKRRWPTCYERWCCPDCPSPCRRPEPTTTVLQQTPSGGYERVESTRSLPKV
jgi:hypothetical protein